MLIECFDNQYSQQTETVAFGSVVVRIPAHHLPKNVNGLAFHQKGAGTRAGRPHTRGNLCIPLPGII
jgi:hypothetical protein